MDTYNGTAFPDHGNGYDCAAADIEAGIHYGLHRETLDTLLSAWEDTQADRKRLRAAKDLKGQHRQ